MRRRYRSGTAPWQGINAGAVALFLGLALLAGGWFFLARSSRFGKAERFNFVVATSPNLFVSLSLKDKSGVAVVLPDDLYIRQVAHGYGEYRLSKVFAAGELDHRGGEVLAATVSDYLGVPVDGYVKSSVGFKADPKGFLLNPGVIFGGKTNLSLYDRLQIMLNAWQIRYDRMPVVDLATLAAPLVLADGTQAETIDQEILDGRLGDIFVEKGLKDEGLRVEVVNATNFQGLGNKAARVLSHIGLSVVDVGSQTGSLAACEVQSSPGKTDSLTARRISTVFACKTQVLNNAGKADIILVLGEDFASQFKR